LGGENEVQMQLQQTGLLFYKFRFVLASVLTVGFLLLISALVTVIGSGTVLAAKPGSLSTTYDTGVPYNPNIVTAGASALAGSTQHSLFSMGGTLYRSCRSITNATTRAGNTTVHGSAIAIGAVWHSTTFAVRGIADSILFTVHMPGKIIGSVTSGRTVNDLIQPADSKPIPVITDETSTAVIAKLSAQQQQEITNLVAGQIAANRALGGTIVTGDSTHGGYPARWDTIPQDSTTDSWGMYNRECVSYTAWKVYQAYGHMPFWGGVGNANEWPGDARRAGIPTSSTPQVHAVAISMAGYYGHAMWVEAVQGNMVYVSQYNYDLHGHYSEMWVNGSGFTYIYFS
jgi:surface antigen